MQRSTVLNQSTLKLGYIHCVAGEKNDAQSDFALTHFRFKGHSSSLSAQATLSVFAPEQGRGLDVRVLRAWETHALTFASFQAPMARIRFWKNRKTSGLALPLCDVGRTRRSVAREVEFGSALDPSAG